jgi:hypothetical protein
MSLSLGKARACALAAVCAIAAASIARADDTTGANSHTPADVYAMVAAIAPSTAQAKLRGAQTFEKVVTIGRNANGEPVVTSMQVLSPGAKPTMPDGTLAVLFAHYEGQCGAPSGADDYPATNGVETFVVSASGANVWEIGFAHGTTSVRLMKSPGSFGDWEAFQKSPDKYVAYGCDKYP